MPTISGRERKAQRLTKVQRASVRRLERAARPGAPRVSGRARRQRGGKQQQGFALLMSLIAIAVLAVLVTDLHETTGMSFAAAVAERDQLKAEYLARSGVNLTRMMIGQERNLRQIIAVPYRLLLKRPPPQLPIWKFTDALLAPFANYDASRYDIASLGVDLTRTEGLGELDGTFEVQASAENGKVNVNDPRMRDIILSQQNVAAVFYSLLGGYMPSPNKYDPLFTAFDEKGRVTTRADVVANVIDWWDQDEQRVTFDPMLATVQSAGGEDIDYYRDQLQPYTIKNAPFDTLEELRLVRGMSDDVWATFVEPDVDDPSRRQLTVYGMSRVNPNEAEPAVILARLCTFKEVREQPLCADAAEPMKFITLLTMARSLGAGVPWFSRSSDFINFVTGKPDSLYSMLSSALGGGDKSGGGAAGGAGGVGALLGGGAGSSFLFQPLIVEDKEVLAEMRRTFGTTGYFFTIEATGRVGNAQRRIRAVINTDPKWAPPPPNAGRQPPLGVFAYYRLD